LDPAGCPDLPQLALDDFGSIKCINFIRSEVQHGRSPLQLLQQLGREGPFPWADDRFMLPVLPDDPLAMYEFDEEPRAGSRCGPPSACAPAPAHRAAAAPGALHLAAERPCGGDRAPLQAGGRRRRGRRERRRRRG
jgi:hypothetical protein